MSNNLIVLCIKKNLRSLKMRSKFSSKGLFSVSLEFMVHMNACIKVKVSPMYNSVGWGVPERGNLPTPGTQFLLSEL